MNDCDKAHVFAICALIILGYRYEWPVCYNIALGISFGSAIFYFIKIYKKFNSEGGK